MCECTRSSTCSLLLYSAQLLLWQRAQYNILPYQCREIPSFPYVPNNSSTEGGGAYATAWRGAIGGQSESRTTELTTTWFPAPARPLALQKKFVKKQALCYMFGALCMQSTYDMHCRNWLEVSSWLGTVVHIFFSYPNVALRGLWCVHIVLILIFVK